jgi:transposase
MRNSYLVNILSNRKRIVKLFRKIRWKNGIRCPHCKNTKVIKWCLYQKVYQRYLCKKCNKTFNDKTATILAYSRYDIQTWLLLFVLLFITHSSMRRISQVLSLPYLSIFRLIKNIMRRLYNFYNTIKIKKLRGIIEVDEVYLNSGLKGFKNISRASRKRGLKRRGRGNFLSDKPPIFAIVSRKRKRVFSVEFNAETFFIQWLLNKYVSRNSLINTDDFPSYKAVEGFKQVSLNHSKREYVKGRYHVNSCESEFSILKPFMAVHRGVNKYHLRFYLACFQLHREISNLSIEEALERIIEILFFLIFCKIINEYIILFKKNLPTTFVN